MTSNKRLVTTAKFSAYALSVFLLVAAATCRAQAPTISSDGANPVAASGLDPGVTSDSFGTGQSQSGAAASTPSPKKSTQGPDDAWHIAVSPYLWFPGVHGTAVGPNGNGLSFRASPSDLLSNFRFGLMGAVEGHHKWLVIPIDMMWIRLEDDNARAFPNLGAVTANIKATEFLLTPKVGVRLINQEKIKVDALTGFRYWHLGENLKFNPSLLGLNFSGS